MNHRVAFLAQFTEDLQVVRHVDRGGGTGFFVVARPGENVVRRDVYAVDKRLFAADDVQRGNGDAVFSDKLGG